MRTAFSEVFGARLFSALGKGFDPSQPRDEAGRWARAGSPGGRPEEDVGPSGRLDRSWVPGHVMAVAAAVRAAGGRALLVGGSVRDGVMGRAPKDYDVEVYGVQPDRLEEALRGVGRVDAVGKSFGVLKVRVGGVDLDVSIPRRESKVGPGHRGFLPQPDPTMTVTDAARRRDFTMNSMAMDPETGDVFDPFGGAADIEGGVIRATDPATFVEDPLRVLRGAQFAARFGMEMDPSTEALCRTIKGSLRELPRERVGAEWEKLLMRLGRPSVGLAAMRRTGAMEVLHPEIEALASTPQDRGWHPEGDVFVHTMMVVDEAVRESAGLPERDRRDVVYAALLHDIAKPETTVVEPDGRITSHGHESAGEEKARRILVEQFAVDKETAARVGKLVGSHLAPQMLHERRGEVGDAAIRRLAKRIEPSTIEALAALARADNFGRSTPDALARRSPETEWLVGRARELKVEREAPKPILQGRHLIEAGMRPGREMGEVLRRVFEMQMAGQVATLDEARAAAGVGR